MSSYNYDLQSEWKDIPGSFADGNRQSPIDIRPEYIVEIDTELTRPFTLTNWDNTVAGGTLTNNGHSVEFTYDQSVKYIGVQRAGVWYRLLQFHFHWGRQSGEGSEHFVDGKSYDAEIHFVCQKEVGSAMDIDKLTVIGVLCKVGSTSSTVWDRLKIPIEYHAKEAVSLSLNELMPGGSTTVNDYFTYEGSLTTPPCTQIVRWIVLKESIAIPDSFLATLRTVKEKSGHPITHNFREIQPIYARPVHYWPPTAPTQLRKKEKNARAPRGQKKGNGSESD